MNAPTFLTGDRLLAALKATGKLEAGEGGISIDVCLFRKNADGTYNRAKCNLFEIYALCLENRGNIKFTSKGYLDVWFPEGE